MSLSDLPTPPPMRASTSTHISQLQCSTLQISKLRILALQATSHTEMETALRVLPLLVSSTSLCLSVSPSLPSLAHARSIDETFIQNLHLILQLVLSSPLSWKPHPPAGGVSKLSVALPSAHTSLPPTVRLYCAEHTPKVSSLSSSRTPKGAAGSQRHKTAGDRRQHRSPTQILTPRASLRATASA